MVAKRPPTKDDLDEFQKDAWRFVDWFKQE